MKYEIEAMRQHQGGVIINMSFLTDSISLTSPHTCFSHRQGLSVIQNEVLKSSDKAIRINCIVPGFTDTTFPETFNLKYKQEISYKNKKEGAKKLEPQYEVIIKIII